MKTKRWDFVEIDYTAKIRDNNLVFDTTFEAIAKENNVYDKNVNYHAVIVCLGDKELIPGLDEFLIGKDTDEEYDVELEPKDAFGEKDSKLYHLVNTNKFLKQKIRPYPGMQVNIDNMFGIVKTVSGGRTMVDFNHPLAGKYVIYKVKINKILEDVNEKINAYLKKIIGKDAKYVFEGGKLTVNYETDENMQKIIAEHIKKIIPDVKDVEFKANNKE